MFVNNWWGCNSLALIFFEKEGEPVGGGVIVGYLEEISEIMQWNKNAQITLHVFPTMVFLYLMQFKI
jgi:hypothetical protein